MNIRNLKILNYLLAIAVLILSFLLIWFVYFSDSEPQNNECDENSQNSYQEQSECPEYTTTDIYGQTYTSDNGTQIIINGLKEDQSVTSPLIITGQVPGNWAFEGDFPVELRDTEGNTISSAIAQLNGDWMTEDLVPFYFSIKFESTNLASNELQLVILKDNPSGLPENEDRLINYLRTTN